MRSILAVALMAVVASAKQEEFHGRTAIEWAADLEALDTRIRSRAVWALTKMGPSAAPATRALAGALDDPSREVRLRAASALGAIGPAARDSVSALIERLDEVDDPSLPFIFGPPDDRRHAAAALAAIGKPALEAVREALTDERENVRIGAAMALAGMGSSAREAVPSLVTILQEDEDLAGAALFALQAIGPAADLALPELRKRLGREGSDAVLVAWTLLTISPETTEAADVLVEVLSSENEEMMPYALDGLSRTPQGPSRLRARLESASVATRISAATLLLRISPEADDARRALEAALLESPSGSAQAVVESLLLAGEAARPALEAMLADTERDLPIRLAAASGLLRMEPTPGTAQELLAETIGSEDPLMRGTALQALRLAGRSAIPVLRRALENAERRVRVEAAMTILEIEPRDARAFVVIDAALRENVEGTRVATSEERARIARSIRTIRQYAESGLWRLPDDQDPIGDILEAGAGALPQLRPLLEDEDPFVRLQGAGMLASLSPGDRDSLRELIALTVEAEDTLASEASWSLIRRASGATSTVALPLLAEAIDIASMEARAKLLEVVAKLERPTVEASRIALELARREEDSTNTDVRIAARGLRHALGGSSSDGIRQLIDELVEADERGWQRVARALGSNAEDQDAVAGELSRALDRPGLTGPSTLRLARTLAQTTDYDRTALDRAIRALLPSLSEAEPSLQIIVAREILLMTGQRRWRYERGSDAPDDAARAAVERLATLAASEDATTAFEAQSGLSELREPAVRSAAELLLEPGLSASGRQALASGLAGFGAVRSAIPRLVEALDHENVEVARAAARALGEGSWKLDADERISKTVAAALKETLAAEDTETRLNAATSLLTLETHVSSAAEVLLQMMQAPDDDQVSPAARAMTRHLRTETLGPHGVSRLAGILGDSQGSPASRYRAAEVLARLAGSALDPLLGALRDGDRTARIDAAWALRFTGESENRRNEAWRKSLLDDLDEDPFEEEDLEAEERREEQLLQSGIEGDRQRAIAALVQAGSQEDPWVQLHATASLLQLRPVDPDLIRRLAKWLAVEDDQLATEAAGQLQPLGSAAVDAVREVLETPGNTPATRLRAASLLTALGTEGGRALDTASRNGSEAVRRAVREARTRDR